MALDARTTMVLELLFEFVEDHVRQAPDRPFGIGDLKQSVGIMLREADISIDLWASDDQWVSDWLDRHPLLLRQPSGRAAWKPGLNVRTRLSRAAS